jgi:hypothetical protein
MITGARIGASIALILGVTLGSASRVTICAQATPPATPLLLLAPDDIKWEPGSRPDTKRANLWGESAKGPFAFLARYEGGWQLPLHFHTNDLRGVILSGTLIIHVAGQSAKALPAGSYFSVPGKTRHTDECKATAPCIIFFTGDAPLDRISVDSTAPPAVPASVPNAKLKARLR